MSGGWLFGLGVLVTVIVAIGLGLPVYGAILDGRDQARANAEAAERLAEVRELPEREPDRRPAA
jgi:hypothetical protein